MRITGSDPVLAIHDLERSGAWYRDVLGCNIDDVAPGNSRFCRAGEVDRVDLTIPFALRRLKRGDRVGDDGIAD